MSNHVAAVLLAFALLQRYCQLEEFVGVSRPGQAVNLLICGPGVGRECLKIVEIYLNLTMPFPSMASLFPPSRGKSVTHVSGTYCYLCLGPLSVRKLLSPTFRSSSAPRMRKARGNHGGRIFIMSPATNPATFIVFVTAPSCSVSPTNLRLGIVPLAYRGVYPSPVTTLLRSRPHEKPEPLASFPQMGI
jgi:hypothetical protein